MADFTPSPQINVEFRDQSEPARADFVQDAPNLVSGITLEDAQFSLYAAEKRASGALTGLGWAFYQDSQYLTAGSGLEIPAFTRTRIPIDGKGALSSRVFAPANSRAWYDQQRFRPNEIGDAFLYRLNISVIPTVNNKDVIFDFDTQTPSYPFEETRTITKGAGQPQRFCLPIPIVFAGQSARNGGMINISAECDITIFRISMTAIKVFEP